MPEHDLNAEGGHRGEGAFERIAIVGLGLIGGSLGLAVRRAWPQAFVLGVDSREDAVSEALSRHVVHAGATDIRAAGDAGLIVLAAPVRANLAALPALVRHALPTAILTDAGSTKRAIVEAWRVSGGRQRFVGGHPLAGAASSGLADASAGLFTGRKWVFTPEDDCPADIVGRLEAFVAALGAVPCTMTADAHDRVMAVVSHLPQLAASALMQVVGDMSGEAGLALAGTGLADTTRIASSAPGIWRDICATNADTIRPALAGYIQALQGLCDDLPQGDELERVFDRARAWRDRLARA